jgi:glycosyltransferase involved in cell wall biosynthesis
VRIRDVPVVSVITPAYNAARYLPDLLRSVAAQDYPGIEHIVIDDGSTDDGATVRVLESHPGLRWWSRSNIGPYATMNEGLRAATGDFVTVICADDLYADAGAVGALARCLIDHPECEVAYGPTLHVDEAGRPLPVQPYQRYPPWMLRHNLGFIFHCSLLVRRDCLVRDDLLFDESFWYIADAEWMLRMSRRYRFRRVERCIGAFRHHAEQRSTTASELASLRRLNEHAALHRRHRTSRVVKAMVGTYNTFHQRRVKALGAWRRGGPRQVLALASGWIERKYSRK